MFKKVLKFCLHGSMESKVIKKTVNGIVQKTRIPIKEDVAYRLVKLWKNPDEDDFYEFVNLLYDNLTIYYSPLESTEGSTTTIPGYAINVTTLQYYDTSRVLMVGGEYIVYIVGDEELIKCIQKVLNYHDARDEKDLESIPELIEIYSSKGFLGREIKYERL